MGDDLVYRVFVELTVLEGKRDLDGNWLTTESKDVSRLLSKAFSVVSRAAIEGSARMQQAGKGKPPQTSSAKA